MGLISTLFLAETFKTPGCTICQICLIYKNLELVRKLTAIVKDLFKPKKLAYREFSLSKARGIS